MHTETQRGFTLLIAIVLTTVLLSVSLALLDIAFKQVTLSSTARQSQHAFYAADSAMECALYWDQQFNRFAFSNATPGTITCNAVSIPVSTSVSGGTRTSTFSIPCEGGGSSASVIIQKTNGTAVCSGSSANSCIFANGYNTCDADSQNRVERGLKVFY